TTKDSTVVHRKISTPTPHLLRKSTQKAPEKGSSANRDMRRLLGADERGLPLPVYAGRPVWAKPPGGSESTAWRAAGNAPLARPGDEPGATTHDSTRLVRRTAAGATPPLCVAGSRPPGEGTGQGSAHRPRQEGPARRGARP